MREAWGAWDPAGRFGPGSKHNRHKPPTEAQDSQSPRTKCSKGKKRAPLGDPPRPEDARQAWHGALEDIVAFGVEVATSPAFQGGNPAELGEDNGTASSNVKTQSNHSDLSDSELEHPVVTPQYGRRPPLRTD
ncbi:hypothetical protein NDU88_001365 [Pleurodeles waltl]|uniref:Uncharacterized protein n=1 Tax=Pleurodeles waltl TaxID=8319 RepID=A0AAV7WKN8_PLEWA|nr:hypothetical protein NDU88_001365 [Pleurodeles waltl]